jgi:GNAT superfamily N-acetyltransferase
VVDAWQNRGVASALLARLSERALEAGIEYLTAEILAENRAVLAMLPGLGQVQTEGEVNFTVPHMGAVLLNAGRTVFGADGTLEFSAGPQGFIDDFYNGNTATVAELCTALGAS